MGEHGLKIKEPKEAQNLINIRKTGSCHKIIEDVQDNLIYKFSGDEKREKI